MSVKLLSSGGGSVTIADPASTASNFTLNPPLKNGTLVAADGTGVVSNAGVIESTSGGFKFPDGTTQTSAASGGVTSLNGQTGAITNTAYGAIGSYIIALVSVAGNATLAEGSTVAGSALLRYSDGSNSGDNNTALNTLAVQGSSSTLTVLTTGYPTTNLALSGTWRTMTRARNVTGGAGYVSTLLVRIS